MLSNVDIRRLLNSIESGLTIFPLVEKSIQPASVDLRLEEVKVPFSDSKLKLDEYPIMLQAGQFLLASTKEYIELPNYLAGRVEGKSSLARQGILVHFTAGFIDPGFKGNITLELFNASKRPFPLIQDMFFCQLCLFRLETPADVVYGDSTLGSKYQGQLGVTEAL